jgi:hypothetical protein
LAVGNNGESLVADSSTSTGLRYQAPVQQNPILNSAFQVWQRGTTGTANSASAGAGFNADRWADYSTNALTISRQATGDTTNLPNIQYCARVQRNSGQTSTGIVYHNYSSESINSIPFAGKTVTFSYYVRAGANFSAASNVFTGKLLSGTGTDQAVIAGFTGQATIGFADTTLTTTWQRVSITGTMASTATQFGILFQYTPTGTASTNDYFEVTGVQLEVGSVATPFHTYAATIQGELAACQRYYYRITPNGVYSAFPSQGAASTTTLAYIQVTAKQTMRVFPTSVEYSALRLYDLQSAATITNLVLDSQSTKDAPQMEVTSSGLTQYRPYVLSANNNANAYIAYSSEL